MRRLYLQIYLAFLGIVAVVVALVLVAGQIVLELHPIENPRIEAAAALLAEQLPDDPAGQAALLGRLGERMRVTLELRDARGQRLAGSGADELPAPRLDGARSQWFHVGQGPAVVVRLADGRWLGAAFEDDNQRNLLAHFALMLLLIVGSVGLLCLPLARRITRRVEKVVLLLTAACISIGAVTSIRRPPRSSDS